MRFVGGRNFTTGVISVILGGLFSGAHAQSGFDQSQSRTLDEACQRGDVQSCIDGSDLLDDDEINNQLYVRFADKACSLGDADSCSSVAYLYDPEEPEEGFRGNLSKYVNYLDKSCNLQSDFDCLILEDIYSNGELVDPDLKKAQSYREKYNQNLATECTGGDAEACYSLGQKARAFVLADQACNLGANHPSSAKNCNQLADWNDPNSGNSAVRSKSASEILLASTTAVMNYERACKISWDDCQFSELSNLRVIIGKNRGYTIANESTKTGDNWISLAEKYCVSMIQLSGLNNMRLSQGTFKEGTIIKVPANGCEENKLSSANFKIEVSDREAQPLVRIPPMMPPRFMENSKHSGYCRVKFDVSPEGAPFNVITTYCTSRMLERSTIKSVQKWKYQPKIVNGTPVARSGVEQKVSYRLADERGRVLPFPDD